MSYTQLYAKVGKRYECTKMADVTPPWTFPKDKPEQVVGGSPKTFLEIKGVLTLNAVVCDIGVDHLLVGVQRASQKREKMLHNNFWSFPFKCIRASE